MTKQARRRAAALTMQLNRIDLNKLNTFLAVAERGGISPAAETLKLTRSAISQSVSSLESSLGVALFHRVGKKLVPTPAGQRLYRAFRAYQIGLRKTFSEIIEGRDEAQGIVRLGLFLGFSKERVSDVISEFVRAHPKVNVKLLFRSQRELAKLLVTNRLDLTLSLQPLSREHSAIVSHKLYEEELQLVAGRGLAKRLTRPEDALSAPVIDYYESSPVFPDWVKHHFGRSTTRANVRAYAATVEYVLELILRDVGIGVIPRQVAEPLVARKQLFRVTTGRPEIRHYIWLNELKGSSPDRAIELFRAALKRPLA